MRASGDEPTHRTRVNVSSNLSRKERVALRQILLAEEISLAEFFAQCARDYIRKKRKTIVIADVNDGT